MNTVRPHTEDEIYDLLKQALDAMKLHTAETYPIVETERAMEMIEAELAQPEALRMVDILENTNQMQPNADLSSQEIADELRRLHQSEREGWRYTKELEQDNANLREQNTWLDTALAERLKQGEKWAVAAQPQQEPVAIVVAAEYEDGSRAGNRLEWRGRNAEDDFPEGTEFYTSPPVQRQPLTTAGYIQALGPLLEHIECSLGTLHCIVRTIEALHGIKEQP